MAAFPKRLLVLAALALVGSCSDDGISVPDASSPAGPDLLAATDLAPRPDLATSPDLAPECGDVPILGPQFDKVSDECRACAIRRCCHQMTMCAEDPDCVATRGCYLTCSGPDDTACTTRCRDAYGNNIASDAVSLCRNAGCTNECANYRCVGNVVWPPPARPTVSLTIVATDYVKGAGVAGATVRICALADAACAAPLGGGTTDADGQLPVTLPTVPGGQGAFLEIAAPGYPQTLAYLARPADQALDGSTPSISLVDDATIATLAASVSVTPDRSKATLLFVAYQCATFRAPGLTVDAGSGTVAYQAGQELSVRAPTTDRSGSGVIFNVTPGATTILSTLKDRRYGSQRFTTRAGAVTVVNVVATP